MSESARCGAVVEGLKELWKLLAKRVCILDGCTKMRKPVSEWARLERSASRSRIFVRRGPLYISSPESGFSSTSVIVLDPDGSVQRALDTAVTVPLNVFGPWIEYLERELPVMRAELDAAWGGTLEGREAGGGSRGGGGDQA